MGNEIFEPLKMTRMGSVSAHAYQGSPEQVARIVSGMDEKILTSDGLMRALPASYYRGLPPEGPMLWGNLRARYCLPTQELIAWLHDKIGGRRAIEICSGHGDLANLLSIPATDSAMQAGQAIGQWLKSMGQTPIIPGPSVERLNASDAVRKHNPEVVVAAYATRKFVRGVDAEGKSQANIYGVKEEALLDYPSVKMYIHIGNEDSHSQKTLLSRPHQEVRLPGLVTRSVAPDKNIIYIWEK